MIGIWIFLLFVAGVLMSFAHSFRWQSLEIEPGLISFILSSIGIALFMKISSLRRRGWVRFALGSWGGLVFFSISMYWLVIALREFGDMPLGIAIIVAAILAIYCSLYMGIWAWLCGLEKLQERPLFFRILCWASAWAGIEALREHLFTGIGWAEIGYHFSFWPSIALAASVWGVHGFSFLWIFFVSLFVHFDELLKSKKLQREVFILSSLIILVGSLGTWWQFSNIEYRDFKVAIIQPNIEQELKWAPDSAESHLRLLMNETQKVVDENPELDLVVWPETSYPFLVSLNQKQLPFSSKVPLIVGAVVSDRRVNYNSALYVLGDQIQQSFHKIHLVPFGEYVPFEDWLPFKKLVANAGRFRHGSTDQTPIAVGEDSVLAGPLICYEDGFAKHSVRHAKKGAQILVNLTNDAWYGKSSALAQHAAMSWMQFYQTGLPIVRATNTGLSSSMDHFSLKKLETYQMGNIVHELKIPKNGFQSWYVRSYPLMQWIWWVIFAIGILWPTQRLTKKIFFRN